MALDAELNLLTRSALIAEYSQLTRSVLDTIRKTLIASSFLPSPLCPLAYISQPAHGIGPPCGTQPAHEIGCCCRRLPALPKTPSSRDRSSIRYGRLSSRTRSALEVEEGGCPLVFYGAILPYLLSGVPLLTGKYFVILLPCLDRNLSFSFGCREEVGISSRGGFYSSSRLKKRSHIWEEDKEGEDEDIKDHALFEEQLHHWVEQEG